MFGDIKQPFGKEKPCAVKSFNAFWRFGVVLMWAVSHSLTSKPGTPRGPGKPLAPGFPWMGKKESSNER